MPWLVAVIRSEDDRALLEQGGATVRATAKRIFLQKQLHGDASNARDLLEGHVSRQRVHGAIASTVSDGRRVNNRRRVDRHRTSGRLRLTSVFHFAFDRHTE